MRSFSVIGCKYCSLDKEKVIFETKTAFVKIGSQHHHGHLSLVYKKHVEDFLELTESEFRDFCADMRMVSEAVTQIFSPDKLNLALNGNWISHIHWHIYPRYKQDPDWGQPIELGRKLKNGERIFKTDVQLEDKPITKNEMNALKAFFKEK